MAWTTSLVQFEVMIDELFRTIQPLAFIDLIVACRFLFEITRVPKVSYHLTCLLSPRYDLSSLGKAYFLGADQGRGRLI